MNNYIGSTIKKIRLGNSLSQYIPYSDCPISYEAKNELDSLTLLYDQSHYLNVDNGIKNNAYLDLCESKLLQKEFAWLKGANAFHVMSNCLFNTDYFYQLLETSESDIFSLLAH